MPVITPDQKALVEKSVTGTLSSLPFPLPPFVYNGFKDGMQSELEKSIAIRNDHENLNATWKKFIGVLERDNKLEKFNELMAKYNAKSILRIMEKLHPGQDIYHTEFHQGGEMGNDVPKVVKVKGTDSEKAVLKSLGEQKGISHDVVQGKPFLSNEIESAKIDLADFDDLVKELDLSPAIMEEAGLKKEDITTLGTAISSTIVESTLLVFGGDSLASKRHEIEKEMYANDPEGFKKRNDNLHFLNVIGFGLEMSDVNRLAFEDIVENAEYHRHIKKVNKSVEKSVPAIATAATEPKATKFSANQSISNSKAVDMGLGQGFRMLCEMHNKFRYVPGSTTAELSVPTRTNTAKQIMVTGLGQPQFDELMKRLGTTEKAATEVATEKAAMNIANFLLTNQLPANIKDTLLTATEDKDRIQILKSAGVLDEKMGSMITALAGINKAKQDEIKSNKSEEISQFLQEKNFSAAESVMKKLLVEGITAQELRTEVLTLPKTTDGKLEATAYLFTTPDEQKAIRDMMQAVRMFSVDGDKAHLEVYNDLLEKHGADLARVFVTSSISSIASDDVGFGLNRDISKIIDNAEESGVEFNGKIDKLAWYKQAVLLDKEQAMPKLETKLTGIKSAIQTKLDKVGVIDSERTALVEERDKFFSLLTDQSDKDVRLDDDLLEKIDSVNMKIDALDSQKTDLNNGITKLTSLAKDLGDLITNAKLESCQDLKSYYQKELQGNPKKATQFLHQTLMSAALQQGVFLMQQRVEKNPELFVSAAASANLESKPYQKQLLSAMIESAKYNLDVKLTSTLETAPGYQPPAPTLMNPALMAEQLEQQAARIKLEQQHSQHPQVSAIKVK